MVFISRLYFYSTSGSYIGQCEWILVLLRKRFILYCRSEEDAVEQTECRKVPSRCVGKTEQGRDSKLRVCV